MTGPSGSGKTTLLTLIGGLRSVQEGSLTVLGNQLRGANNSFLEQVRKQIGFIFQSHNLLGSLTAIQNVEMALALQDIPSMDIAHERAAKILDSVGLGNFLDALPSQLSGGQKQRVAIARALVNQPKVILADEPTASLDKASGRDVVELMQHLARQQDCTILLVTHDNRILDIADRILSLEDGRLTSTTDKFIYDIQNMMTLIQRSGEGDMKSRIEGLTLQQFSTFLEQLNHEFEQFLQTVSLLNEQTLTNKLEEIIDAVALQIGDRLQADRVTIFVADPANQILWSKIARGKDREQLDITIPINSGIAGYVATSGQSVNIPDAYSDPRFNPDVDRKTGYRTRSILCLPLKNTREEIFAVVQILNKLDGSCFDSEDEEKFFTFSNALASILESFFLLAQQYHVQMQQNAVL